MTDDDPFAPTLFTDPFFDNAVFPVEKTVEHGGVAPIKMV